LFRVVVARAGQIDGRVGLPILQQVGPTQHGPVPLWNAIAQSRKSEKVRAEPRPPRQRISGVRHGKIGTIL
jgi:hypothetical protein